MSDEPIPDALDILFNKNPVDLSESDLDEMIMAFRSQRAAWVKAEAEAQAQGKKRVTAPKAQIAGPKVDVKLDELDLGSEETPKASFNLSELL